MNWLFKLLSLLPLSLLHGVGAVVGEIVFWLSPGYRRRTRENLRQAGFNQKEIFSKAGRNAGRQALESIWVWYRPAKEVLKRVTIDEASQELICRLMSGKRPVVFMTPHVGCFEVLPVWLAETFYKTTGRSISILYRPPRKSILRKIVGEARQADGIEACPTNIVGIKRVIRNLREGHTFGALPDQVPSLGEGVWADFFGRPAYTMTLPLKIATQFDAVRIFAWGRREKHGWVIGAQLWDEPLTGEKTTDALLMNRAIESIVRQMPEQYAWSYNRYKCPSGVKRPEPIKE